MKELDFDRILMLLTLIKECQLHGLLYQEIAAEAQREMKSITADIQSRLASNKQKTVTPADGGDPKPKAIPSKTIDEPIPHRRI